MALASTHHEVDELGDGKVRHIQYMKRIAYWDAGSLVRSVNEFVDGDASWPHVVAQASQPLYTAADGMRRFHPTREADRYLEIGAPYIKPSTTWQKVNLGTATRTANRLAWTTTNANVYIDHGGHFVKMGILLKNGWVPPNNQVAFPVGLSGLTRQGGNILRDGVVVAHLTPPVVYDLDSTIDVRAITWAFMTVGGQAYVLFTLPSLAGMSRPVVDPTLTLQPDAADGVDTFIYSSASYTNTNSGVATMIGVGDLYGGTDILRTLIKFNLTSLPEAAVISSAILSLYMNAELSSSNTTVRVYRQKRAWLEGTRNFADDTPATGATWGRYDTTNNWSSAGGFHVDDCEQTDIGSRGFTGTETVNEFKDFALTPVTKVALDLGNGWLVKCDNEATTRYDFDSSDHATAGQRPKLVIEYTEAGGVVRPIRAPGWGRW